MVPEDLDRVEGALVELARIGVKFAPPPYNVILGAALPIIESLVRHQIAQVKIGIADGTIVADGNGGFVPASNSHYDPKTGEFLS